MNEALFIQVDRCWVCGGTEFQAMNEERVILKNVESDPDMWPVIRPYDGHTFTLNRCRGLWVHATLRPSVSCRLFRLHL